MPSKVYAACLVVVTLSGLNMQGHNHFLFYELEAAIVWLLSMKKQNILTLVCSTQQAQKLEINYNILLSKMRI